MDNMPKGIGFFNINTGETRYAQLEAQIQGYLNSSDLGINASRDQDFGWRLAKEWVAMVRAFRKDETKMQRLADRNGGQKVTVPQILHAIYGEQVRAAEEKASEEEHPFEEQYLQDIREAETKLVAPDDDNVDDLKEQPEQAKTAPKKK